MAGKRKANAAKAKAATTTNRTTDETLHHLDQAVIDDEGSAKRRRQQLQRRDTEEKADRAVQLHFSHVPRIIIETKTINGLTVRERVTQDLRSLKATKGRLGTKYWSDLVQEYAGSCDPCAALVVTDTGESVSDALVAALQHAKSSNPAQRTPEPLLNYLSQASDMNQREFIGLLKTASKLTQISGKAATDQVMVGIMKFISKNNLAEKFKEEVKTMLVLFDPAMCRHYASLKHSGVNLTTYLDCNLGLVSLLLDQADVQAVIDAGGVWGKVKNQLARLTQSCQLGAAMFHFSEKLLASSEFSELVDKELKKLSVSIQQKSIDKFRKVCTEAATQFMKQGKATGKKQIKVEFAGFELVMLATGAQHEWQLKLAGLLKTEALKSKCLQPLVYEEWILGGSMGSGQEVPAEELLDNMKARQMVKEILQDDSIACFADMQKLISTNAHSIMTVDRTFAVELKYLDLAPEALEGAIKKKLIKILPSASQSVSFNQASLQLEELKASTMCRRASRASMGQVEAYLEIVGNMQRGVAPDPDPAKDNQFYKKILSQLAWFCEYTPRAADDKAETKVIRGPEALKRQHADMLSKMGAGSGAAEVTLGDLEVFQTYRWLLTEAEKKTAGSLGQLCPEEHLQAVPGLGSSNSCSSIGSIGIKFNTVEPEGQDCWWWGH